MCNVRHDVKDTLLNVPLLTKGKKNLKHIATNRNYVHAGIYSMKRPKINSHSQVSLSSGKPIKCRISLFFRCGDNDASNQGPRIMFLHV